MTILFKIKVSDLEARKACKPAMRRVALIARRGVITGTPENLLSLVEAFAPWIGWLVEEGICPPLQGANLQGAYLREADLQGAYLQGANLQRADLREAYLQGAYLQGANLQGAYLQGVDFWGAYRLDSDPPIDRWKVAEGRLTPA